MPDVQHVEHPPPGPAADRFGRARLEYPGQGDAAEVRHAQQPEVPPAILLHAVQRDDVRVLEPGQRQVLAAVARGQLQHDEPVGEGRLAGEEHPPAGAPAELGD